MEFLEGIGIDASVAMSGFDRWNPVLQVAMKKITSKKAGQGGIGLKDGMILFGLVRAIQPEYIVETGVAAGISTSFLGAALLENGHGHLYSIELPVSSGEESTLSDGSRYSWHEHGVGWAIPEEIRKAVRGRHSLILSDVREALPQILRDIPYVDLFFHDDLHTPEHMLWEYELVWPRLRPGGILLSDDANYGWVEFCRRHKLASRLHNVDRLCAAQRPGSSAMAEHLCSSSTGALCRKVLMTEQKT
jgi:predicted O-methyltransferase YrrM